VKIARAIERLADVSTTMIYTALLEERSRRMLLPGFSRARAVG